MKKNIFLLALMLFMFNAQAQKVETDQIHYKRHMCATTIVGISSLTVGVGGIVGGLLMQWSAGTEVERGGNLSQNPGLEAQYQHDNNTALAVTDVGIALGIAGLGMTIAGAIHDKQHNRRPKLSLIAPKRNEFGFAYNF